MPLCVLFLGSKTRLLGNVVDWYAIFMIGLCSVLRPCQHSIGYMGDGFYRSKDPTNIIKVLNENLQRKNQTTQRTKYTYSYPQ